MAHAYEADTHTYLLAKDNRITRQMAAARAQTHATGANNAWTRDANRTCSLATFLNPFYNKHCCSDARSPYTTYSVYKVVNSIIM